MFVHVQFPTFRNIKAAYYVSPSINVKVMLAFTYFPVSTAKVLMLKNYRIIPVISAVFITGFEATCQYKYHSAENCQKVKRTFHGNVFYENNCGVKDRQSCYSVFCLHLSGGSIFNIRSAILPASYPVLPAFGASDFYHDYRIKCINW